MAAAASADDALWDGLAAGIARRERRVVARAISLVENGEEGARQLLARLQGALGRAWRIGITGPPGAGKSTLCAELAAALRARGATVAVIAVDPSSPFSGGALLGDRVRMEKVWADEGVFIRSMAARSALGGLSAHASDAADVLDAAGFEVILIETVGVGQSELEIARAADTALVVLTPESGDEVQAVKAGLMEIADVFVLNKSDRPGSDAAHAALQSMLVVRRREQPTGAWLAPVVRTAASEGAGTQALLDALDAHRRHASTHGELERRRRSRAGRAGAHAAAGPSRAAERVMTRPPIDYLPPLEDLVFVLTEVLDCRSLFELEAFRHADLDSAASVLAAGARFAREVLAPLNAAGDEHGAVLEDGAVRTAPGFREAYARYVADGWPGLDMPPGFGGQGLPRTVQAAFAEMVNGACIAFAMLPLMCRAATRLLAEHARGELAQRFCPKLASGEWGATICISEPQAGSDVGRIRTLAVPGADGRHRLSGTKIFISYGDQDLTPQIAHLVLARTPGAPAGTRGISLFLVPKRRLGADGSPGEPNGVHVQRLEHKMGLKASPTCVLQFEDSEGVLVGELHRGLNAMFTMVNTMRLEVAMQGVALAGAATQRALRYAAERLQGGEPDRPAVPIVSHADVRRMLLVMRARTEAMRALVLEAALQLDRAASAPDAGQRREAAALAEWLLPICKAHATDSGCEVTQLAVQVLGGHGYVADAGVEQYARDGRVSAIYEGTNGIQALDLVTRKLVRDQGARLRLFVQRVRADLQGSGGAAGAGAIAAALAEQLERLERASAHLLATAGARPRDVEAAATPYLRLAGIVAGGWMWLRMAAAASRGDAARAQRKRVCAQLYAEQLMPECALLERQLMAGAATLDLLDGESLIGP